MTHEKTARVADAEREEVQHEPLLAVNGLEVQFQTREGVVHAVRSVDYAVGRGETLGVIGESGCGKSVTAQAIMGILPKNATVTGGSVRLGDTELLTLKPERLRRLRGESIAMIFQDALSALNPVFTVGFQIAELYRKKRGISRKESLRLAVQALQEVQIPDAKSRLNDYPHQFSGGMRQRVMIAMALALDPEVLIADEPTTALDVTVQDQIMDLLSGIQQEREMGMILITHDLGVVAEVADRVAVMYAGRVVERASVKDLFASPRHPYTKALLRSIPRFDRKEQKLETIEGAPPSLLHVPAGCAFHSRCAYAKARCLEEDPTLDAVGRDRSVACHFWTEVSS